MAYCAKCHRTSSLNGGRFACRHCSPVERERLRVMRAALTKSTQPVSFGGRLKTGNAAPKPITMPRLKCLEVDDAG